MANGKCLRVSDYEEPARRYCPGWLTERLRMPCRCRHLETADMPRYPSCFHSGSLLFRAWFQSLSLHHYLLVRLVARGCRRRRDCGNGTSKYSSVCLATSAASAKPPGAPETRIGTPSHWQSWARGHQPCDECAAWPCHCL